MPAPSVTYTFTNATTADATEVNQNFTDLVNSLTDGLKDLTINAITCNGAATFNGAVTLGNATADDITVTGSLASSIPIKTNNTYDIGSATLGLRKLYIGNGGAGATCDIISASHATTREYTVPDCGAAASFVMTQLAQTISGVKTFDGQLIGKGTATNDNPTAGYIGEVLQSTVTTYTNVAATATFFDLTSLSITAGDWLISGAVSYTRNSATITSSDYVIGYSTTTGNSSAGLTEGDNYFNENPVNTTYGKIIITLAPSRLSLASTTTYYLKGYSGGYSAGNPQYVCRITALRIR